MARTVQIKGYVYEVDWGYGEPPKYGVYNSDQSADAYHTLVGPAEFSYTLPEGFNSKAAKLATLQAEQAKVRAEFAKRMKELSDAIQSLTAIEMTEVA